MSTFKEINEKIQIITEALKGGETDMKEATSLVAEYLDDYTSSDDAVIPFKDYKIKEGVGNNHIQSGILELDDITGGFGKGDLQLISGDTGDGKTTFARFLITKFSKQKKKCCGI